MTRNTLDQTPSQTVGPYFAYGLAPAQYGYAYASAFGAELADRSTPGEAIEIIGRVFDGDGKPIGDALIEIAQRDAQGRPVGAALGFTGFGRCGTGTDPEHRFRFRTVKPGAADGEAPHVDVIVLMRGLLVHAFTRIYFSDEAAANAADPLLAAVPADRRGTLIARREDLPGGAVYHFDIRMQGPDETVFFDL